MVLRLALAILQLRRVGAATAFAWLFALAPAKAEQKALVGVALVVGQSDYENLDRLTNPANDAKAIDHLLSDLGFDVDLVADADRKKLNRSLERFVEDAAEADVALIYYSGHGIEAGGENFLVPVDADVSALDRASETLVPVSKVIAELQATVPVTIVLLDACRNSPFPAGAMVKLDDGTEAVPVAAGGLSAPRGVVALGGKGNAGGDGNAEGLGTVIGFAAAPGHVALDGEPGGNSPYAAALLKHIAAPGFAFSDVMTMVTEEVYLKTGAQQVPWINASLRRLLYFGGTAEEEENNDQAAIRGERRKLLLTISTLGDVQRQQVIAKSRSDGVPMDALFAMLKAIGADTPQDPEQLSKLLEEQSARLKTLLDERETLKSADPEIGRLSGLAKDAVSEGALETAISFRERAKERVVSLSATVDQTESDLRAKRIEFASVFADSAETYVLAYESARAAEDFAKAYDQVAKWDDGLAVGYKLKEAKALSDLGFYKADGDANRRAIEAYRLAARLAPPEKDPVNWASSQTGLAMALWNTGQRAADTAQLDEAATLLKTAIASPALAHSPEQRAQLEASLTLVLLTLGGREAGTQNLEEAASYARDALTVRTRETTPIEWARLQNNLGFALYLHGVREQSDERIVEAEAAFRAALEVWTRENDPLAWANVQNNLGVAIGQLGSSQPGTEMLEEAAGYISAALDVRTREIAPLSWAESLSNLASTYHKIGERSGDPRWFDQAVATLREAMTEITRERDPLKWAAMQMNVGMMLSSTAVLTGTPEPLYEALAAYDHALTERTRERVPLDWALTMNSIGNAYNRLGQITNDARAYHAAVEAFTGALEELTPERSMAAWARAQNNLANALATIGETEEGIDSQSQALEHYRLALEAHPVEVNPMGHAETQYNIAVALLNIGRKTGRQEDFDAARVAAKASHDIYIAAGQRQYDSYFENIEIGIQLSETEWLVKRKQKELEGQGQQ